MAVITLDYANTLKEAPANDGTVEGNVVITLTESTFAGTNGQALPGVTFGNVPPGLTAVLVRTNDNTATLTFTGKATTHKADITNLTVTLTATSFDSGADINGVNLVKDNLLIDFDEAPTGGGSEPPASHVPFSGPLFITSVEELATGAGGDPTIGAAGKVKLTGYAATPDSTITIFNGSKKVGDSVKPNAVTGVWTFETPSLDKAGVYNFTAKETFIDNSGAKEKTLYGGPSNTLTYTVDTKAPPAPKVDKFKLPTANTTPTITGKAEKFAEVEVFAKLGEATPTSLGKVQANDKGIWSLQVEDALLEGTYALTAKATDAAGNTSEPNSKAETLTIDTSVAAFSITADKGLKYSDGDAKVWATKKFSSQKLEGKAEANSVIHFFGGPDGTVPLGKPVKVNKSGDWKATLKLTDGAHVISAVIIDQAGNISDSQSVGTIKVDSFAPIVTVKKEDKTPTKLSGLVEHDAVEVEVFAGGKNSLGKVTTGLEDGIWELDVTGKDIKGKQKITVIAKDAAGNVSKPSAGVTYDFTEAAGDGGGDAFTVKATDGVLAFAGTATGDITVTNDAGTLTFTRSGTAAETKPAITSLNNDTGIPALTGTDKLVMTDAVYTAIADKLAPAAAVKLSDPELNLANLKTIEAGQTGLVDATAVTATTGTVEDAKLLLVTNKGTTGDKIDMAAAVAVTLTDATTTLQAADLSAIGGATTGTVTVTNSQTISGTSAEVIAALATAATKVEMATNKVATVDLSEAATFTAAELTSVYGANGGTVIGTVADTITVTTLDNETVAATESIDTFVFGATDTDVVITDFTFGAAGDMLDVSDFIDAEKSENLNVTIAGSLNASFMNVVSLTDIQDLTAANFGGSASALVIKTAANKSLFVVADVAGDEDAIQNLYYVITNGSNEATVTLVGTINEGTLHADNFVTA